MFAPPLSLCGCLQESVDVAALAACGCDACALLCGAEQPSGGFPAAPGIKGKAEVPVDEASVTWR